MKTTIIIFSKNRTLQLKSLLLSLVSNTDCDMDAVNVIYTSDIPEISYEPLIQSFSSVNFIKEGDFLTDVKNLVKDSNSNYIQFMVDDLIVRDSYSYEVIEEFLDCHSDVDSFCLRIGTNIKCGKVPEFREYENDILVWRTTKGLGQHWNYQWEVSSSIYRKKLVEKYLAKCRHDRETFPNPFEDHFYACMPTTYQLPLHVVAFNAIRFLFCRKYMNIACFRVSKCFTQGVNVVANIEDNIERKFEPLTLHKKMLEGYVADIEQLKEFIPQQPNCGGKVFKLVKEKELKR